MVRDEEKRALLAKLLKIEGVVLFAVGMAFVLKSYFTDWTLTDTDTDMIIGYALVLVGFINFFIATRFFGNDAK